MQRVYKRQPLKRKKIVISLAAGNMQLSVNGRVIAYTPSPMEVGDNLADALEALNIPNVEVVKEWSYAEKA